MTPESEDQPINEREAMTMAYVDGELEAADRARFEQWLASDAELAAEVADYQVMLDLSRSAGELEPTDHELRRFWTRFHNRAQWRLGWLLLIAGGAVLVGFAVYTLCCATSVPWIVKVAVLTMLTGAGLLLGSVLRQRLRTRRLDRYRGVIR